MWWTNDSDAEFEFERSQRGRPILKYRNFRYRRERVFGEVVSWRCAHKTCKGRLSLNHSNGEIMKFNEHDICFLAVIKRKKRALAKSSTDYSLTAALLTPNNEETIPVIQEITKFDT